MNQMSNDGMKRELRQVRSETPGPTPAPRSTPRTSLSMHEGVAVWCDCCSCEAEPYWLEAGATADQDPDDHADSRQ